jgi:hypothetical protein
MAIRIERVDILRLLHWRGHQKPRVAAVDIAQWLLAGWENAKQPDKESVLIPGVA